jgi:hypothetical protein
VRCGLVCLEKVGDAGSVPVRRELVGEVAKPRIRASGVRASRERGHASRGGVITSTAYLVIFHQAREAAFTEAETESLVAQRPYDLRHAAVSTWLNATGDPAQVAEWAGHTVDVLLRVYAKCIAGRQEAAKRRIFDATRPLRAPEPPNPAEPEP